MRSVVVLSVWISLTLGNTVTPSYKGCFSTKVVQHYAFYYKMNHSLSLQQCLSACNNKLTHYMGLEVDTSSPYYNYVFCGNDLAEVSPKTHNDQCYPCEENSSFSCGRNGTMSVYLLRDSTPLSLLLATNRGVEILSDNITTLKVAHYNTSRYKSLDYVYTADMIVSAIDTSFLRSFYNPLAMKYSQHYRFYHQSYHSPSLAVDFISRFLYYGYSSNRKLYRGTTLGIYSETSVLSALSTSYPDQISIDPYNKSLVFLENNLNEINILTWRGNFYTISLSHLHVEKISALSMDVHEMLLYAILTFNGDTTSYLVSLDYRVSQMRVLFSGYQLENALRLEVFRDHAVWLREISGVSTVFQCKLTPRCQLENVTLFQSNQTIFDFVIYHPEKQTPGRRRLCANMTCSHGCQLVTPFSAICSCPPGMEMDPDSSTCKMSSTVVSTVASSPPSRESSMSPVDSTTVRATLVSTVASSPPPRESSMSPVDSTTARDLSTLVPEVKLPKNNNESSFSFKEILLMFGFSSLTLLILVLCILVFDLYRKNNRITQQRCKDIVEPRIELKSLENHYMEIPLFTNK